MTAGESILPGETVIELIQLVGDVVMFADHRSKPDVAFSMPRESWDALGNPTVVTVTVCPGGDFVPKGDKPQGLDPYVSVEQALAKLGGTSTGAYL